MSTRIQRRMFLRGLGGAVVAAPFLSSVWERQAKAASAPKTLIVMFRRANRRMSRQKPTRLPYS